MRSAPATMAADRIPFLSIRMIADESLPQAKRPLRQDAGARDAVSESSPSLGRAHRLRAGAGAQLAAHRVRQSGAGRRTRRRSGLARDARHRGAMGRPGRPTRPSAGGSPGDRGLQTDRRANRLASGALYRTGAVDPGRSDHRAAELARGLRLRHDRGALALNDYARTNDPFAKVGKVQIAVDVSSVIRASQDSFRVAWVERRYENGSLASTERWTAIVTIVIENPRDADRLRRNPLGLFVHALNWSKELV